MVLTFEAKQFPKLQSEIVFADRVLNETHLSSLSYGIVSVNKRVT